MSQAPMNKALLVALRELRENVRTKGFWIGILTFPLILAAFVVIPTMMERGRDVQHYAVIDNSGWLLVEVDREIAVQDFSIVFAEVARRFAAGDVAKLPPVLADNAAAIADLGPVTPAAARAIALDQAQLLPPNAAPLANAAEPLRDWMASLDVEAAREISGGLSRSRFLRVPAAGGEPALNEQIENGELFAYVVIGPDPVASSAGSRYVSRNIIDEGLSDYFADHATGVVRARRLAQEQVSPQVASWIQEPVRFEAQKIGESGEAEGVAAQDRLRQFAPTFFVYFLWISVFMGSQMLLTNIVEEKSNRIIEVLLSSVSPYQLMVGKIAGIAATGFVILATWMLTFYLGAKFLPDLMGADLPVDLSAIAGDPIYLLSFLFYFVFGYLFYAALLAAIGSVVNTLKEAQNLMTPVTLLLLVPLILMLPISRDPNSTVAVVLSYVPPFTPFVMMNRAAGPPTTLEYVTTTLLLIASVWVAMWAAAKVFRIGVLMTGKPPKLSEIIRWIRAPVGAVPETREA